VAEFANAVTARVRLNDDGDARAPGGAITVALCGGWDHVGQCRWPHRTDVRSEGDVLVVTCRFDAPDDEVEFVSARIRLAIASGRQRGPDGRVTTWFGL